MEKTSILEHLRASYIEEQACLEKTCLGTIIEEQAFMEQTMFLNNY